MKRVIGHTLVALTLAGCAGGAASSPAAQASVELTRIGEAVQVTENALTVRECEFVANLSGQRALSEDAVRAIRNEAGRQGANFVLMVMSTRTTLDRAEGYLCAD